MKFRLPFMFQRLSTVFQDVSAAAAVTMAIFALFIGESHLNAASDPGDDREREIERPDDTSRISICGHVVRGVRCLLLEGEDRQLYLVEGLARWQPGDLVRVEGVLVRRCSSVCQQRTACIKRATFTRCDPNRIASSEAATFSIFDLLDLLDAWGSSCPDAEAGCQWDLTGDGMVGLEDLLHLIERLD